jgi:MarR family transcriptional regulator for hemolysin
MEKDKMILIEIGQMMKDIFRVIKNQCNKEIETNLTPEQTGLLFVLSKRKDEATQKDLAECMGKDKSSILRLTDALEEKDLVRRVTDRNDRRKNYLMVTKKGQNVLQQHIKIMNDIMLQLQQGISEADLQVFFNVVNQFKTKAGEL